MSQSLNFSQLDGLSEKLEEATRSTEESIHRFVEPASGTLRRAKSHSHHLIFGRRGSGKSSLLRKAKADLVDSGVPCIFVDMEAFKGHSYPDVVISALIKILGGVKDALRADQDSGFRKRSTVLSRLWRKAASIVNPTPDDDRRRAEKKLENMAIEEEKELQALLYQSEELPTETVAEERRETTSESSVSGEIGTSGVGVGGKAARTHSAQNAQTIKQTYTTRKSDFLVRRIPRYQQIFSEISAYSKCDTFLFVDDLYHIRRADQTQLLDYLHRIAKGHRLWLKVGTIKHRTSWYVNADPPLGMKLGDDANEIDLDISLEKYQIAKGFLFRILEEFLSALEGKRLSLNQFLTGEARERLVLASGGVARDFLGILRGAIEVYRNRIEEKGSDKISAEDVNNASGDYESKKREELKRDTIDEENALNTQFTAIVDFCKKSMHSNVFLMKKDSTSQLYDLVQELVDLRLIHKIQSRVTIPGTPGEIYEGYMLDLSQYSGARKMRNFNMIEFWKGSGQSELRKISLVYNRSA